MEAHPLMSSSSATFRAHISVPSILILSIQFSVLYIQHLDQYDNDLKRRLFASCHTPEIQNLNISSYFEAFLNFLFNYTHLHCQTCFCPLIRKSRFQGGWIGGNMSVSVPSCILVQAFRGSSTLHSSYKKYLGLRKCWPKFINCRRVPASTVSHIRTSYLHP